MPKKRPTMSKASAQISADFQKEAQLVLEILVRCMKEMSAQERTLFVEKNVHLLVRLDSHLSPFLAKSQASREQIVMLTLAIPEIPL